MITLRLALSKRARKVTLVVLACTGLLTPPAAFSAEQDGTVLFFSFEDLKQTLSHPSHPALPQLFPGFSRRNQREQTGQPSPLERYYRWGKGQGVDGATRPGTRPLWGY